jgi:hypothetical protein
MSKMKKELRELGLIGEPWQPKVGDVVDAIDRRDGKTVERGRKIVKIETHDVPGVGKSRVALLEGCCYFLSVRCLRKHAS